jgi:hypothetical protein
MTCVAERSRRVVVTVNYAPRGKLLIIMSEANAGPEVYARNEMLTMLSFDARGKFTMRHIGWLGIRC